MFAVEELADVTLVAAGGRRFAAHRAVLAASSSVFRAMFAHPHLQEASCARVRACCVCMFVSACVHA